MKTRRNPWRSISSVEIEWLGFLLRIIFRGPRRITIGKTGSWFFAHFYFIGFALRTRLHG